MANSKKIIIFLIVTALAVGGFFLLRTFVGVKTKVVLPPATEDSAYANIDKVKQQEFYDTLKKSYSSDQDMDGLPDSEEPNYQTSATSSDSDNDGLSDWQEISIYGTSPIKTDDDGDGYADGYEVRRGFNPKGEGKLPETKKP